MLKLMQAPVFRDDSHVTYGNNTMITPGPYMLNEHYLTVILIS